MLFQEKLSTKNMVIAAKCKIKVQTLINLTIKLLQFIKMTSIEKKQKKTNRK